jgi:two-component system response regulator NreC
VEPFERIACLDASLAAPTRSVALRRNPLLRPRSGWQACLVRAEAADRDKTTVVIADDHTVVRQGLRLLIDADPDMQVVAEAGNVPDAERLTRAHRPTVLVLDLNMPGGSSLDAIPRLLEATAETAIVVLTMQDDPGFARRALQDGALGFVLKEAADEELLAAIRLAARGDTYLNPRLGARLATQPPEPAGPPDDLTDREVEVLRLIALGHTNSEIGQQLYLSTRTVETHRAHIQQKLRRNSRAELVRYALEHNLVDV